MADQHNDNIPAVGNQITSDVVDIKENLEFHKDCFEKLCDGWSNTATTDLRLKAISLYNLFTHFFRAKFANGTTAYTLDMTGAEYWCKDKFCYWDSALTTLELTEDYETPDADTWYYLYLDYSEITTNVEITNTEFFWSSTAPTWDNGYKQWLNSDDRCIFAAMTNGTPDDFIDFLHDGNNFVFYASPYESRASSALTTTFTDVILDIPDFADYMAKVIFAQPDTAGQPDIFWRPDGTSIDGYNTYTNYYGEVNPVDVLTNSSQTIEVKHASNGYSLSVNVLGWFFPRGM